MNEILLKIKEKALAHERKRQLPEVQQAFYLLGQNGYLIYNRQPLGQAHKPVPIAAFLAAGELEPRVWEVLPAMAFHHAELILDQENLPDDLKQILRGVEQNLPEDVLPPFHRVEPRKYLHWLRAK